MLRQIYNISKLEDFSFSKKEVVKNLDGCKVITVGHFSSIQLYPELKKLFVSTINHRHKKIDALIFTGKITLKNSSKELKDFKKLINQIQTNKFIVFDDDRFSNIVDLGACNLIMLNTKDGKLSDKSFDKLKNLKKTSKTNLVFMNRFLYSAGLTFYNFDFNVESKNEFEKEKNWRNYIQPIIKGKVSAIFAGDRPRFRTATYMKIDGIPYISNAFTHTFGKKNNEKSYLSLSYTVVEVKKKKIDIKIEHLPIPINSEWFKFDRDFKYNKFKKDYENSLSKERN